MQYVAHSLSRRLFKSLALSLALLSILFLVQIVPHAHANSHEAAACRICQVGHLGVTPVTTAISLSVPFVSFGQVAVAAVLTCSQNYSSHSSSRAPPASIPA